MRPLAAAISQCWRVCPPCPPCLRREFLPAIRLTTETRRARRRTQTMTAVSDIDSEGAENDSRTKRPDHCHHFRIHANSLFPDSNPGADQQQSGAGYLGHKN